MLSDDAINNLIQPIVDRQEAINTFVLQLIANRLGQIGTMSKSDLWRLRMMFEMGVDAQKLNKELSRITNLQVRDIRRIIEEVARDSYLDVKPFYDYRELPYIPFAENKRIQQIVNAIAVQTSNTYVNLSNSKMIGMVTHDSITGKRKVFRSVESTYKTTIDQAIQASQSGIIDYQTAIRRSMKQLVDSGIRRLAWDSGYTQRLDTAVKRNILDGIRQVNQQVQNATGEEFGADGIELTAHFNPAPDHASVQGHQFTKEQFERMQSGMSCKDVQGRTYAGFPRAIGELNCKHLAYSIIIGHAKQNFTDAQLKQILADNEVGYTFPNGRHLTGYGCLQYQNQLALKVRQAKDGQIAARQMKDDELAKEYQRKVNKYVQQYNAFSKAAGISERKDKLTVSGYRRISTK